ncbi:hypothetical protein Cpir12675_004188 [Ceratocystis pirilliformis]|uniref:NB-ARC domain-containing protein n=1 Tax=Ceratocystis pirilliformis TaxID=259994 RepID=A0ABR3YYV5_9PEZI
MTIDQCAQAYRKFSENVSTTGEHGLELYSSSGVYSARKLEDMIKQVIRESYTETKCQRQRDIGTSKNDFCSHEDVLFHDDTCTPTVVLAIAKSAEGAEPMLFKTYHLPADFSECKAWEINRATSAVAPAFTSIQLGEDEIECISSGYGRQETILRIGTGLSGAIRNPRYSIASALRGMAASSSAANIRLQKCYFHTGQYFRFDVDNGLQDFMPLDRDRTRRIPSHVKNCHDEKEYMIDEFVSTCINGTARPGHLHRRRQVLSALNDKLFAQPGFQQVVLVGFGGTGKTQVALELAHTVKNDRPEYSVFWLPGASMTVFDDAYKELVEELKIEGANDENQKTMDEGCEGEMIGNKDPKMLIKRYLESQNAGNWLLVLDDVDDFDVFGTPKEMKAPMHHFLPRSELRRILVTARTDDVAWKALDTRVDVVELDEMSPEELGAILGRSAEALHSQLSVNDLVKELNHLPLAVAQAADCISMSNMPVPDYLEVLGTTNQHKIAFLRDRHTGDTDHGRYQSAIAIAWPIAFDQIEKASQPAVRLLEFIAIIDSKAIPLSILTGLEASSSRKMQLTYCWDMASLTDGRLPTHSTCITLCTLLPDYGIKV